MKKGGQFGQTREEIEKKYGIPIINKPGFPLHRLQLFQPPVQGKTRFSLH